MRSILIIGLAVLFGCTTSKTDAESSSHSPQNKQELSDEQIIEIINKQSKFEFTDDDLCIVRPSSFKGLALIGYFAHDRGCRGDDAIYDGKIIKIDDVTSRVLNDYGWKKDESRKKLALDWMSQVMLVWSSVVSTKPDDFKENNITGFHKPLVEEKDGFIIAKCWVKAPSGMLPQAEYYQYEAHFQKSDASVHKVRTFNHVTIDY